MKFTHEAWTVKKLIDLYQSKKINLSPPYQRNAVWTLKDQRTLVDTIIKNQPIPSFFVLKCDGQYEYEMVDGQQRTRALIAFIKGNIKGLDGEVFSGEDSSVNDYKLNFTVINEINEDEAIEYFYALVNKAGKKLNKPELDKAQYYDTKFLKLLEELADSEEFGQLGLFRSTNRMNDIDLISELVALLEFGISDKKLKVTDLYESDIDDNKYKELGKKFYNVVSVINEWSKEYPFNKTRYKQKNDIYTLFSFIIEFIDKPDVLKVAYDWLLVFDEYISPSLEECEPLQEYAVNCVTQSNSKKARERRLKLLKAFLFPELDQKVTTELMSFFEIEDEGIVAIGGFKMYDPSLIEE